MGVESRIDVNLQSIGMSVDQLTGNSLKYLTEVETYFDSIDSRMGELIAELKRCNQTFVSVAAAIGRSRTTLYKDPIVQKYIEQRIQQSNSANPLNENEMLSNTIKQLNQIIEQLKEHDIDMEILRHENEILSRKIEAISKRFTT